MKLSVFLLALCFALPAYAQYQAKSPKLPRVQFECDCTDQVGMLYATYFRDLLASSPRYTTDGYQESGGAPGNPPSMHVSVVSMATPGGNNNSSVISVAILLGQRFFLTQLVQYCPAPKAHECAQNAFAVLDQETQPLLADLDKKAN